MSGETPFRSACSRREVLGLIAASTMVGLRAEEEKSVVADRVWTPWKPGELQIHLIHTGVGECQFLIFPDGTTLMIDCGDQPAVTRQELSVPVVPDATRLAGEWAARYVLRVNPNKDKVDYLEITHWHADHTGYVGWQSSAHGPDMKLKDVFRSGVGLAAQFLHFGKAIDRGYPDYADPIPTDDGPLSSLGHMKRVYAALQARDGLTVEKFRLGATDQLVPLKGKVEGFSVFNLCANGRIAMPDGSMTDVYGDLFEDGHKPRGINENGMSLGHIIRYGNFSYYTAGDFSDHRKMKDGSTWAIESAMANAVGPVSAAKLNHHGHHSMPNALVRALRPRVWTACVWDQLHTVPGTLRRLCDPANSPEGRLPTLIPGVFPSPRTECEAAEPYFAQLEPACLKTGCHVVLTVPPNATTFHVDCLSAADESMTVLSSRDYPLVERSA